MHDERTGTITQINGPVIYLKDAPDFRMGEMVYVGKERLVGEVIGLNRDLTTVQVYEETSGLRPGSTVTGTGAAISVLLGPGILHNIYDGVQRPLSVIAEQSGKYIGRGLSVSSLDEEKKWHARITVRTGQVVGGGTVIAETRETPSIVHRSMVPPSVDTAEVIWAAPEGDYTIQDVIVRIRCTD